MSVAGGHTLVRPVAEACEVAANALNVERVGVWLFVENGTALRCYHLFERAHGARSEGLLLRGKDIPTYFRALQERCYVRADDAHSDANTKELRDVYLIPLGITSMLDAPIYFDGQVRGVVCHEHVGVRRTWADEDCDFASSVADKLALLGEQAARLNAEHRALTLGEHAVELEKMKAVAQLAAGAAHDVRSMVSVVRWAAHAIGSQANTSEIVQSNTDRILSATESVMALLRDLETVGQEGSSTPQIVSAVLEVARLTPILQAAAGTSHPIEIRATGTPGLLLIDRTQLERVVLNLVVNARDAMPGGGPITIEVGETTVDDDDCGSAVFTTVAVSDSGVGISPLVRKRIFDPFFTTKPRGSGTGLGLTVVNTVAERSGGFVHVDSELGNGTTFRVYLPRVSAGSQPRMTE